MPSVDEFQNQQSVKVMVRLNVVPFIVKEKVNEIKEIRLKIDFKRTELVDMRQYIKSYVVLMYEF